MEVILLEDVKKLGKKDDVVEVNSGYANNYLIKKGLAVEANKKNTNEIKQKKAAEKASEARNLKEAREKAAELKGQTFTIKMKSGEDGKLYGSVTNQDVANLLQKEGYTIDKRNISLNGNIKNVGTTSAVLKLHNEVSVEVGIKVESL